MMVTDFVSARKKYTHTWPGGVEETYEALEFATDEQVKVTVAFTVRPVFNRDRRKVTVFFDDWPAVEYTAADDYTDTGDLVSLIRRRGGRDYYGADESVPPEYMSFRTAAYSGRIGEPGAFNSIAVVVNVADVRIMIQHALIQWGWRTQ